ncbi:stage II sporulation protein M [Sediminivirga luteola]|uniref:Membrane protein n=1 Tax=Sediminivirga luteola TaxID=1774748 RepID=A0A8J2TZ14_9MICO|nr:stage II sporulation protein M [Sediminivirga luteola]GGA18435.1 membrane protein [Sediminivirga luteola]
MDLAALIAVKSPSWDRLDELARRRRLNGAEADEMVALYQQAATDLSAIQSVAPGNDIAVRLSSILARARVSFTGQPEGAFAGVARFFAESLPLSLYRLRWVMAGVTAGFLGFAWLIGAWVAGDAQVQNTLMPPAAQQALVENDFVNYYSENPAEVFALGVWTNNAWIALQWVVLGITGYYVIYGLLINAFNLGATAGVLHAHGEAGTFWVYILPHGLPEIMCILIAAAAGLRIFWSWVRPGPMLRRTAVAREARSLLLVALGLVLLLALSALVEAYVTPNRDMPDALRIGIGAVFVAGVGVYAGTLGRRALRAGRSADLRREHAGETQIAAD